MHHIIMTVITDKYSVTGLSLSQSLANHYQTAMMWAIDIMTYYTVHIRHNNTHYRTRERGGKEEEGRDERREKGSW